MYEPYSWLLGLTRVATFLLIALLIGFLLGNALLALALAAIWLLAVQYWNIYRLNKWLWLSKRITPPQVRGFWEHIYEGIYSLQRRNRRKRKNLSKLIRRFREGSEALPDAAVVVDSNANIVWCNRLARIELGLRWPQDRGRRIDNLIRNPKFLNFFHSGNYDHPIEVTSPLNPSKVFEYRIMPYWENHLLIMVRDVTRVTQLEQMRKDFVANVSHELRTPLTVLNGYLEMMPDPASVTPKQLEKAVTEMSKQTERMQSLIEQLLVLSRIEASAERVADKIVDVPMLLRSIESEAQTLNKDKQHTLTFDIDARLHLYGIETELRSAFSNLIFNAIHYTPAGGEILISWREQAGKARFSVKDNGEGIASKHISRLTERFYRVDGARSRKTGGSGLGLAIVKHVLSHHNSELKVKSQVGQGSEFWFSFSQELTVKRNQSGATEHQIG